VLSRHPDRRQIASDAFRCAGAVVVETNTLHQAHAILQQFQFDILAVDFFGLGVGVTGLLHDMGVDFPATHICVIGPPEYSGVLARFLTSYFPYRPVACSDEQLDSGDV